jgi:Family of unknown function (DUF6235)
MLNPTEPTSSSGYRPRFRMDTGLDILEHWADTATQSAKNAVYKALFAVSDGSVFQVYRTVDDMQRANEYFVLIKKDLVLKIRVNCFDSFGIAYIGPGDLNPDELGGLPGSF